MPRYTQPEPDQQLLDAPRWLLGQGKLEPFKLDRSEHVAAWVKNDHPDSRSPTHFRGIIRKFRPDYLVRLANGKMLMLEVKGQDNQKQQTKREFLSEWVQAVKGHGGFGTWAADVSGHAIHDILQRHGA